MKYIYLFSLSLFVLTTTLYANGLELTKKEQIWIENHPQIKVSNELDWAPFDFAINGEARGYSVDLIKLLAKKIGIRVAFVNGYTWTELLEQFDAGSIDLMHVMNKTKERVQKYSYSAPYMPWQLSYIIRKDETNIVSPKDFSGKKVAIGKDWASTSVVKRRYPKAIIIEYTSSKKMLEDLSLSKVDIVIENILAANYIMSENFITNIKQGGYLDTQEKGLNHFYFVSAKKAPELASLFMKAYKTLSLDEKLKLQEKWFSKEKNIDNKFTTQEKAYLRNKKVIKMCIDPDWMPFERFDKHENYIGMTADYFKIFQKEMGILIEPIHTKSWTESIEIAKSRKCDIFSLAMETQERKKYMNFTSTYMSIPLVLATKTNVAFMDDIKYLKHEKIGITKGYAFNEIIRKKYPNIEVVDVENINEGLQKVANGELFGFVDTLASVGYAFQRNFVGELKIAGKFSEKWELGIGVRNDEPLLLSIFEKEVNGLSTETKQHILNKYIAIQYEKITDYRLLIKVLFGVFIIGVFALYHIRKLAKINEKLLTLKNALEEQANHDSMTHLYNRRYFHSIATNLLNLAFREKYNLSVIMIDIDFFKKVNDTYGHATGDEVIKKLALIMLENTRESDIVARFGGEEFVILLPKTDLEGALNIANKLKVIVENEIIIVDKRKSFSFTISLGVSKVLSSDSKIDAVLNRADKALYRAKKNGRNRVVIYEE